jgi:hypothetical protein
MPGGLPRARRPEASHVWRTRRRVLVPGGRAPDSEGNGHDAPLEGAMGQATSRLPVPWPTAEGPGRPHPTVVDRRAGRPLSGAHARMVAWVPPASSARAGRRRIPWAWRSLRSRLGRRHQDNGRTPYRVPQHWSVFCKSRANCGREIYCLAQNTDDWHGGTTRHCEGPGTFRRAENQALAHEI